MTDGICDEMDELNNARPTRHDLLCSLYACDDPLRLLTLALTLWCYVGLWFMTGPAWLSRAAVRVASHALNPELGARTSKHDVTDTLSSEGQPTNLEHPSHNARALFLPPLSRTERRSTRAESVLALSAL